MSTKIAVIVGSTRPSRIGRHVADWFVDHVSDMHGASFTIIDLRDINLPFLDEVHTPSTGIYQKDHTKQWKQLIDSFDAYVFVTAEYNAGYPAPLKNAIDYLKDEWADKPAAIISYGWGGGAGAAQQLRQVLERLKMAVVGVQPQLVFGPDTFDENAQLRDIEASFGDQVPALQQAMQQLLSK